MAHRIIMPKQGLQMTEGIITAWLKQEGDLVKLDEPLFEMETDKLAITINSTAAGTLLKILRQADEVVPITQTIAVIGEPGEDYSNLLTEESDHAAEEKKSCKEELQAEPSGYQYDVAVLGAGPGGYECAIRCAQYGLKVALIEAKELGGTCLNRGCIPTKALLESAHLYKLISRAKEFGISVGETSFCYAGVADRKDKIVSRLRKGVEMLEKANGVCVIRGYGKLVNAHTIAVNERLVTAANIVLATGSAPAHLPIPGIENEGIFTSDDVLSFTKLPESVIIVGGGVIGVEFATLLSGFGKKVTIIELMPHILPTVDAEIADLAAADLKKNGVRIITNAKVLSFEKSDQVRVICEEDGKQLAFSGDCCIISIGRKPQTDGLGLEQIGIHMDRSFVKVNDHMQTSVPNIYAIGDITGKIQLAHVATAQGMVAAACCAGKDKKMRYDIVPSCIYTDPEIACVGTTASDNEKAGRKIRIGRFDIGTNGKAMVMGAKGLVKLVVDALSGEILGCQIYGPRATDLIGEIVAVMQSEGTAEELSASIHPHPTVCEVIMEAAHDTEGMSCNAIPKR